MKTIKLHNSKLEELIKEFDVSQYSDEYIIDQINESDESSLKIYDNNDDEVIKLFTYTEDFLTAFSYDTYDHRHDYITTEDGTYYTTVDLSSDELIKIYNEEFEQTKPLSYIDLLNKVNSNHPTKVNYDDLPCDKDDAYNHDAVSCALTETVISLMNLGEGDLVLAIMRDVILVNNLTSWDEL